MIPFDSIETVFLDVGNTLVSIDFQRVASALAALGTPVDPGSLRRAEAASRPRISKRFAVTPWREPEEPFVVYLRGILTELERNHLHVPLSIAFTGHPEVVKGFRVRWLMLACPLISAALWAFATWKFLCP